MTQSLPIDDGKDMGVAAPSAAALAGDAPSPSVSALRAPAANAWPSGYADALIVLTPGQESALAAYDHAMQLRDDQAIRETRYHLDAWDRHFGRESTITLRDRRNAALRRWGAYIFTDGAGI